jgi:hypothetical protein
MAGKRKGGRKNKRTRERRGKERKNVCIILTEIAPTVLVVLTETTLAKTALSVLIFY